MRGPAGVESSTPNQVLIEPPQNADNWGHYFKEQGNYLEYGIYGQVWAAEALSSTFCLVLIK